MKAGAWAELGKIQEGVQPGHDDQLVKGYEFHEGNQLYRNYDENGGNQPKYGTVGGDGGLTWEHNVTVDQSKDGLNDIHGGGMIDMV